MKIDANGMGICVHHMINHFFLNTEHLRQNMEILSDTLFLKPYGLQWFLKLHKHPHTGDENKIKC